MADIEYWKTQWSEAQQFSSLASGYNRSDNWENFWNLFAGRYARENREKLAFHQGIVEHLIREGAVSSSDEVLDIGCGPGTFSLPLALKGARVTGLDTAPQMLTVLKQESAYYGVDKRIKTLLSNWDLLADEISYDLVMGANTPAIMDYDSLMKMNRLSRKCCCLISFAGAYHSILRRELWQHIMDKPLKSRAFDIQFPFNILYLEGYLPNIRFFPYRWEPTCELAEAIEHYLGYFSLFGKEGKAVKRSIQSFLEKRQHNGLVQDTQEGTIAVIWWQVKSIYSD